MTTKTEIKAPVTPTARQTARSAPSLHLVDVKVGFLPPWDNARYIYLPIGKKAGYRKKLGKVQKAILELLEQRPYTRSGLELALNKRLGNIWNHLLSLNRRGLLAHIFLTDVNAFGCPVTYHYYALAKDAGDGSLPSLLELGIRCLEVAEEDRVEGIARSIANYKRHVIMAYEGDYHPRKLPKLIEKLHSLEHQPHSNGHPSPQSSSIGFKTIPTPA
jgi:hypothetical protein